MLSWLTSRGAILRAAIAAAVVGPVILGAPSLASAEPSAPEELPVLPPTDSEVAALPLSVVLTFVAILLLSAVVWRLQVRRARSASDPREPMSR